MVEDSVLICCVVLLWFLADHSSRANDVSRRLGEFLRSGVTFLRVFREYAKNGTGVPELSVSLVSQFLEGKTMATLKEGKHRYKDASDIVRVQLRYIMCLSVRCVQ